jgi:hypothetical protein
LFTYLQAPALPQRQQVLQKGEADEAEFNLEALPPQESVTIIYSTIAGECRNPEPDFVNV